MFQEPFLHLFPHEYINTHRLIYLPLCPRQPLLPSDEVRVPFVTSGSSDAAGSAVNHGLRSANGGELPAGAVTHQEAQS